jgi:hypothetical protein
VDTLRALYAHDPNFAGISINYGMQCFITDTHARSSKKIVPVLHVLIDNGAHLNDGRGPSCEALYSAILGSQPLEVVDNMVQKGARVGSRVFHLAIENERLDVLQTLLRSSQLENSVKSDNIFEWAKKTGI